MVTQYHLLGYILSHNATCCWHFFCPDICLFSKVSFEKLTKATPTKTTDSGSSDDDFEACKFGC